MKSKAYPILFSGEMITAMLEGRKTMTRRIVRSAQGITTLDSCPYGQIGDKLWVRETWRVGGWRNDSEKDSYELGIDYKSTIDKKESHWCKVPYDVYQHYVSKALASLYKTNHPMRADNSYDWKEGSAPLGWYPSIHIPRWASRLSLEIVNVRTEHLLDISREDAIAEGAPYNKKTGITVWHCDLTDEECWDEDPRVWFFGLWEFLNGKRPNGSINDNPLVWVVEFKSA